MTKKHRHVIYQRQGLITSSKSCPWTLMIPVVCFVTFYTFSRHTKLGIYRLYVDNIIMHSSGLFCSFFNSFLKGRAMCNLCLIIGKWQKVKIFRAQSYNLLLESILKVGFNDNEVIQQTEWFFTLTQCYSMSMTCIIMQKLA